VQKECFFLGEKEEVLVIKGWTEATDSIAKTITLDILPY
jgi:hypothetical protein